MAHDRKKQIIKEATRLFARSGYDSVTVKQLASACDITEPALYRHFASKEAIYDAVLDALKSQLSCDQLFAHLEEEDSIEIILREMAAHILGFFDRNREVYRLLLYSALRHHAKAREVFRSIRGPFVTFLNERLDRLYDAGRIREKNNQITARCFVGMVFDCALGATLWKGFQGKQYTPNEIIANNVPIFASGLMPESASVGDSELDI
jgi:AcrR family transcriptional regulator